MKVSLKFEKFQTLILFPNIAFSWLREVRLKNLCLQIQRYIELLRANVFYYQFMCRGSVGGRDIRQVSLVDIQLFYRLEVCFLLSIQGKNNRQFFIMWGLCLDFSLTLLALKLTGVALLKATTVINDTSQSFRSMQQIISVMTHPILLPFQHVYASDTTLFLANVFICLYSFHFRITGKIK